MMEILESENKDFKSNLFFKIESKIKKYISDLK